MCIPVKITGDKGLFFAGEYPFHGAPGIAPERFVDAVPVNHFFYGNNEIDKRDIRRRHPDRDALYPVAEMGHDLRNCPESAGCRGRHGNTRRPAPSQIPVRLINKRLVLCICMDRCHETEFNAIFLVQHLDDRRKAEICFAELAGEPEESFGRRYPKNPLVAKGRAALEALRKESTLAAPAAPAAAPTNGTP